MSKPTVTIDDATGIAIIAVQDEWLDEYNAADLRDVSVRLVSELKYRQILDLAAVRDAKTIGLGVIVGAEKRALHHGGCLVLTGVGVDLAHTLRITGLDKKLIIASSIESAIAFFQPDVVWEDADDDTEDDYDEEGNGR